MNENLSLCDVDFKEGYIAIIDKPLEWTSTDVVRKIKYALQHRLGYKKIKIGHAGTLDPLATGVLIVCIGKATKMVNGRRLSLTAFSVILILDKPAEESDIAVF